MTIKGKDKEINRQTEELTSPAAGVNSLFMDSSLGLHGAITFIMSFFPSFSPTKRKIYSDHFK